MSVLYGAISADSSKNMGQFYFYYAGAGSNSNRLSAGLHSVDDVFNIFGSGNIMIGTTTDSGHKLNISGTLNATGAITQGGNQVLHAGNYTSYSPTLTGGSASGTWGISITGNAATATTAVNVTGTVAIANGGTGQTTRPTAPAPR